MILWLWFSDCSGYNLGLHFICSCELWLYVKNSGYIIIWSISVINATGKREKSFNWMSLLYELWIFFFYLCSLVIGKYKYSLLNAFACWNSKFWSALPVQLTYCGKWTASCVQYLTSILLHCCPVIQLCHFLSRASLTIWHYTKIKCITIEGMGVKLGNGGGTEW